MTEVDLHEAKTQLSSLLRRVNAGEEIVIALSGKPVAKLISVDGEPKRIFGLDKGLFEVPEDFNDPLPDDLLAQFNH